MERRDLAEVQGTWSVKPQLACFEMGFTMRWTCLTGQDGSKKYKNALDTSEQSSKDKLGRSERLSIRFLPSPASSIHSSDSTLASTTQEKACM